MNDDLLQKLADATSPEDVQACLDEAGVKLPATESKDKDDSNPFGAKGKEKDEPKDDEPKGKGKGNPFGKGGYDAARDEAMDKAADDLGMEF
jgi:hypothetical protein